MTMMAMPFDVSSAAPVAWINRKKISIGRSVAKPHSVEPMRKIRKPPVYISLRPKMSARRPKIGAKAASVSR